ATALRDRRRRRHRALRQRPRHVDCYVDRLASEAARGADLPPDRMSPHRPKILVVDDEPPLRELVAVTLGDAFICDQVGDGDEALVRLNEVHYDLVMLDVMMPGTNGTDVLRKMREDDELRNVPVIVMSAWQSPQDVASALEA